VLTRVWGKIRCFPYVELSDVPRLQQVEKRRRTAEESRTTVTTDSSKFISLSSSISSSADRNNRVNLSTIMFVQKVLNHFMECSEHVRNSQKKYTLCLQISLYMHITWTSWFTSLTIKVYYLDILDYKSHYKGTLPRHSSLSSLIINVHYLDTLVYKSYYKFTLPGHPGLQVSL
jgi:hypothetical protein